MRHDRYRAALHVMLALALAGCRPLVDSTACLKLDPDATTCPAAADVSPNDLEGWCGEKVRSIEGEGEISVPTSGCGEDTDEGASWCCYPTKATPVPPNYPEPG